MSLTTEHIPTGLDDLDRLLGGGFATRRLSLAYGEAATGKTTLLMQTSIQASRLGYRVLYIDSDRSFTHQRFNQIAGTDAATVSQQILLFMPESFSEQRWMVENLENYVTPLARLVVIDTITSLYRAAFRSSEPVFSLNRDLNRQLAYLGELAMKRNLAVVVTSQVHAQLETAFGRIEPVARRTLLHWPKTVLNMKNTPRPGIKEIILERHAGIEPSSRRCLAALTGRGFESASTKSYV